MALPARYKAFLQSTNGGQPSMPLCFAIPEAGEEVMLGVLFGLADETDSSLSLEENYADGKEEIPTGFVPIGEDPGGNRLLLGIGGDCDDGVFFWDRVGRIFERTGVRLFRIAANIDGFLTALRPVDDG